MYLKLKLNVSMYLANVLKVSGRLNISTLNGVCLIGVFEVRCFYDMRSISIFNGINYMLFD